MGDQKLSLEELLKDIDAQADGADEEEIREMANRKELETAKFKLSDKDGDGLLILMSFPRCSIPRQTMRSSSSRPRPHSRRRTRMVTASSRRKSFGRATPLTARTQGCPTRRRKTLRSSTRT